MNAKISMLSLLSIRPHMLREVIRLLPYSRHTVYKVASDLHSSGHIIRRRVGKEVEVALSTRYDADLLGRMLRNAIIHGIDPERIINDDTRLVYSSIQGEKTLDELGIETGLSYRRVRRSIGVLMDGGVIVRTKKRPLTLWRVPDHPLGRLLDSSSRFNVSDRVTLASVSSPVRVHLLRPEDLERVLFEHLEDGLSVRGTGLMTIGKGPLEVYMSTQEGVSPEELFLQLLDTPEGVEDLCPQMIAGRLVDLDCLSKLAIKRMRVNELGAYLEVLSEMGLNVPKEVMAFLESNVSGIIVTFPRWEEEPSLKDEVHTRLEQKWTVDLRIDMDALAHGVRSL
jgi:hypothetical protein